MYSPESRRDRDRAISLYEQAIEAQPGAKLNAQLANRIAQLYAFYRKPDNSVVPDHGKAAQWWKLCAEWSDPTQLLWAQAQMGSASAGAIQRQHGSSISKYDTILAIDPNTIQLDNWKQRSVERSGYQQAQDREELEHTRQQFRKLQARVREKQAYAAKISAARIQIQEARTIGWAKQPK